MDGYNGMKIFWTIGLFVFGYCWGYRIIDNERYIMRYIRLR